MTFLPEQIMTSEDWMEKHKGHKVIDEIEDFDLSDGWVKRMHYRKCVTCGHTHLHKMETVQTNKTEG